MAPPDNGVEVEKLRERVSEIVSGLYATHPVEHLKRVYRSYSWGRPFRYGDDEFPDESESYYDDVKEVREEPDTEKRERAAAELDSLVRENDIGLLLRVPVKEVVYKIGEVYGAEATPHFIGALQERMSERQVRTEAPTPPSASPETDIFVFANALASYGDERALPVLMDASEVWSYMELSVRLKGMGGLLAEVLDGDLPGNFREKVIERLRSPVPLLDSSIMSLSSPVFSHFTSPRYLQTDLNDLKLLKKMVEGDPEAIQIVFDNPNTEANWNYKRYASLFRDMGTAGVPTLMRIMTSEDYQDSLRSCAAVELRGVGDPETDNDLLRMVMLEYPNARYAAKALQRNYRGSEFGRTVIDAFLSHWKVTDREDWELTLAMNREGIDFTPELMAIAVDKSRDPGLRYRVVDVLCGYMFIREREKWEELLEYFLKEGEGEHDIFGPMLSPGDSDSYPPPSDENMFWVYGVAQNPERPKKERIRAIRILGDFTVPQNNWGGVYYIKEYLGKTGSRLLGWLNEPDREIREAAKEAYAKLVS